MNITEMFNRFIDFQEYKYNNIFDLNYSSSIW